MLCKYFLLRQRKWVQFQSILKESWLKIKISQDLPIPPNPVYLHKFSLLSPNMAFFSLFIWIYLIRKILCLNQLYIKLLEKGLRYIIPFRPSPEAFLPNTVMQIIRSPFRDPFRPLFWTPTVMSLYKLLWRNFGGDDKAESSWGGDSLFGWW